MSDSSSVVFAGAHITVRPGESVLSALLNAGYSIPYGCQSGVCHACKLHCSEGNLPAQAQKNLTETEQADGTLLACQCYPQSPLTLDYAPQQAKLNAYLLEKTWLSEQVIKLRLSAPLSARGGQYITLWAIPNTPRCYSIANDPTQTDYLECHIRIWPNGVFSQWLAHTAAPGDTIEVQGPLGNVYYSPSNQPSSVQQPLLLIGLSTGLSPLLGVIKTALNTGHEGPINLVFGAQTSQGLYYLQELSALSQTHQQLTLHTLVQSGETAHATTADIYTYCKEYFPELDNTQVYLAGSESFVQKMRKQCFLSGAAMSAIKADAFISHQTEKH